MPESETIMPFEQIGNKDMLVLTARMPGIDAASSASYTYFFIAPRAYDVMEVHAIWEQASVSGTVQIERLSGTEAPSNGDEILVSTIDTSGTANTLTTRKNTDLQNRKLEVGDRLAFENAGDTSSLLSLTFTMVLKPLGKGDYR